MTAFEKIYEVVRAIPKGCVMTYGAVALAAGNPRWARVVGYALHRNPDPMHIPCHRVVKIDGGLAEGFAFGGMDAQRQLLESEGVRFINGKVDLERCHVK